MVAKYGMSDRLGAVSYETGGEVFIGRDYERQSPTLSGSRGDRRRGSQPDGTGLRPATAILKADSHRLLAVAEFLLEHETMAREQFEALMAQDCAQIALEGSDKAERL